MNLEHTRNAVLSSLPAIETNILRQYLEAELLPVGTVLAEFDRPISRVYFFESGLGSTVLASPDGHLVETLIVGRDGYAGIPIALGIDRMPMKVFVQSRCMAWAIDADDLRMLIPRLPTLHAAMLAYVASSFVQISYTALSNASHRVEQRLARWLLMAHDRIDDEFIDLTHEFLAMMLNVRRSTVTDTLHILEGLRLVRSQRGRIIIRDRPGLIALASPAYGVPEETHRSTFHAIGRRPNADSDATSPAASTGLL